MGPQRYFSSRSKQSNGNWNEGFLFTISFHNQLFDTIEVKLYIFVLFILVNFFLALTLYTFLFLIYSWICLINEKDGDLKLAILEKQNYEYQHLMNVQKSFSRKIIISVSYSICLFLVDDFEHNLTQLCFLFVMLSFLYFTILSISPSSSPSPSSILSLLQ